MQAKIIDRKWVVEWFDQRQCYHMPSLTMADNGSLLTVWNGGFLQWNGDPMGRDAKDWVSILEPGAANWSNPDAVGCDIRYCCHDPIWIKNKNGEITLLFAKFLDTEVNFATWCNGRTNFGCARRRTAGVPGCQRIPRTSRADTRATTACCCRMARSCSPALSSELPDKYFGAIRIYISHDNGETFEQGPILFAEDGNLIREPALCLRPNGVIRLFSRTCPGNVGWGSAGNHSLPSYTCESRDGGKT